MKVYLAGPMRGIPEFNFPAFHAAAAMLRLAGHEVFNPAEHDEQLSAQGIEITVRRVLKDDLSWICENAEMIALLPGWKKSLGATAEHATALAIGLEILELA